MSSGAALRIHDAELADGGALVATGEEATTSAAACPARSISSPIGPRLMLTDAWVAIAPTPASSQGTTGPTPRKCDWTATAKRPVSGSRATML